MIQLPDNKYLLPFQTDAVNEMVSLIRENGIGCYNAYEQGLGKTIQAIALMNSAARKKNLIICPAVMRETWKKELLAWGLSNDRLPLKEDQILIAYKPAQLKTETFEYADYVICSYNLLVKEEAVTILKKEFFQFLVMDEAHYLKNEKAKRSEAVFYALWPKAKYRVALSGTPFTKNVIDGYSLFSRFLPGHWHDYREFGYKFAYPRMTPWAIQFKGIKNAAELSQMIRNSFYLRKRKEEVMKDLPPKIWTKIVLGAEYRLPEMNIDQDIEKEIQILLKKLEEGGTVPILPETLAGQRKAQGMIKVPAVIEFVENLLDQEIPVVLFGWHRDVLAEYVKKLAKHKPAVITGDTTPKARTKAVADFQAGKTKLFIGQMAAAGVGITLTAASNVVFGEFDYSPANISQAAGRAHRIGTKNVVNIYYFVVEKSIEEDIIDTVFQKARDFSKVIDNEAA